MNDNFTMNLSVYEIGLRIGMAIIIGGMIGYERGHNNRPAGFRTHILVCLGAAVVSMVQDHLRINIVRFAMENGNVAQVIKTDLGRIGAQVVSGIGFLGAGTIMRDKGTIGGLTTAASIWVTGCIGLGVGWGFYSMSFLSGLAVLLVLITLKKVERRFIDDRTISKIEIEYDSEINNGMYYSNTNEIFKEFSIRVRSMKKDPNENRILYTLIIPRQYSILDLTSEFSKNKEVTSIKIIK